MENRRFRFEHLCVIYGIPMHNSDGSARPLNVLCEELFAQVRKYDDYSRFVIYIDSLYGKEDFTVDEWDYFYGINQDKEWLKSGRYS